MCSLRGEKGIGLYSKEQERNTTAFHYLGQLIIGALVLTLGIARLCGGLAIRREEIRQFGAAEFHILGWLETLGIIVIGAFMAHAGAIFYFRRAWRAISRHIHR